MIRSSAFIKYLLVTLIGGSLGFNAVCQTPDTVQHVIEGRVNSPEQQKKPYVIMISIDGMRYDYAQKYKATHLLEAAKNGVQAKALIPSFPSITFPNHYTLVTGQYPSHTGLVGNKFYDRSSNTYYVSKGAVAREPRWYGGTPLWVLAEKQNMLSAGFYWVGSDVAIQNTYPSYYYAYNEKISIGSRINTVVKWLQLPAEKRPHLINLYFPQVDYAGHHFGPESVETEKAVLLIDSALNELEQEVKKTGLPVNFVFVSDHGMVRVNNTAPMQVPLNLIDTAKFRVTGEDVLVELYAKDTSAIKSTYQTLQKHEGNKYKVYLRTNAPKHWHYDKANDHYNRIADILMVPTAPNVFIYTANGTRNPGAHGYDPALVPEMRATFYAWGPDVKSGVTLDEFKNVDIYPVVAKLLELNLTEKIDGTDEVAKQVVKTK